MHLQRDAQSDFGDELHVLLEDVVRVRLDVLLEEEGTHVGHGRRRLRFEQVRRDDGSSLLQFKTRMTSPKLKSGGYKIAQTSSNGVRFQYASSRSSMV